MKDNQNKKSSHQFIAKQRIEELFFQAEEAESRNLSNRYVSLAKKISLKHKVPFTKKQKENFCKKCENYLKAGKNSRIRLNKGKKVVKCLNCGNIRRLIYK